jgi:hypothetical protein
MQSLDPNAPADVADAASASRRAAKDAAHMSKSEYVDAITSLAGEAAMLGACGSVPLGATQEQVRGLALVAGNYNALVDSLSFLAVSRSYQTETPAVQADIEDTHAIYCPRSRQQHSTSKTVHRRAQPGASDSAVGATPEADAEGEDAECLCAAATPLPCRVTVNQAFTDMFGWTQEEVQRMVRAEGEAWQRRLFPPSMWLGRMMHDSERVQRMLLVVLSMATVARQRLTGAPLVAKAGEAASNPSVAVPPFASSPSSSSSSTNPRALSMQIQHRSGRLQSALVSDGQLLGSDGSMVLVTSFRLQHEEPGLANVAQPPSQPLSPPPTLP